MESEVNDLKDDLDTERKDRQRADKQRKDLSEELEALKTELEETTETGAVQQQVRLHYLSCQNTLPQLSDSVVVLLLAHG